MCGGQSFKGRRSGAFARLSLLVLCVALVYDNPLLRMSHGASAQSDADTDLDALQRPEVLYVRGCQDAASVDVRETTGCFATETIKGKSTVPNSVHLSLQGTRLPANVHGYRVVLQEYRRPSLLGEPINTGVEDAKFEKISLLCERPSASELFPTQLIACDVVNPLVTMNRSAAWAPHLQRLVAKPMWFDVRLEKQPHPDVPFHLVSVLRRAVQLDVQNVSDAEHATGEAMLKRQQRTLSWEEVRQHPLERLYAPVGVFQEKRSKKANTSAASNNSRGAEDLYGSDDNAEESGEDLWVGLGIGGLKRELRSLFRRVFLSRLPSLAPLAEALQLQHVRGVILYGPPGNGKTLIARNLFRLLGPNTRLSVVNAADVLSKFVGESEKNLRDVFEGYDIGTTSQAEDAAKEGGAFDKSAHRQSASGRTGAGGTDSLQVLVIDEFEALFRRRGHSNDESSAKAVYDGVTNTLLSLMDGIKSRNNLLVVGLTNRLQVIDPALLRPGRFEVLIEIPAPDVPGREDIFFIHTDRLREHDFLAADVDLHSLALESGGFSGSDIAGTVRSAISYALLRYRKDGLFASAVADHGGSSESTKTEPHHESHSGGAAASELAGHRPSDFYGAHAVGWTGHDDAAAGSSASASSQAEFTPAPFKITRADFERAMKEIREAKDESSALSQLASEGDGAGSAVLDYDGTVRRNLDRATAAIERVMQSERTVTGLITITGAPGTGKSTVARALTRVYDFTTVRYFSCRRLAELRDREEQLAKLRDALSEASHTERGLVVLDDYDVLVDSIGLGGNYAAMTLRGLLYEYLHRPSGVSRALVADSPLMNVEDVGGETDGGQMFVNAGSRVSAERNHRVLVLTSSLPSVLQQQSFDVQVHVHPVLRNGAASLLQAYRVVNAVHAAKVASAYPVSMSYRAFLRVTDMALQRWVRDVNAGNDAVMSEDDAAAASSAAGLVELPAYFATSDAAKDTYEELQTEQTLADFYAVTTEEASRSLAAMVRATVANMGLMDLYEGWRGEGLDVEGDEDADGVTAAAEVDGFVDVDELVGMADEVLW